jgi:hypothetical protein
LKASVEAAGRTLSGTSLVGATKTHVNIADRDPQWTKSAKRTELTEEGRATEKNKVLLPVTHSTLCQFLWWNQIAIGDYGESARNDPARAALFWPPVGVAARPGPARSLK